jgi:hypothetical protein
MAALSQPVRAQTAYPPPPATPDAYGGPTAIPTTPAFATATSPFDNPTQPVPVFDTPTVDFGQPFATSPVATPIVTGALAPTPAQPQGVLPTSVSLGGTATSIDVGVTGAPAFRGFELTLSYDPSIVVATGASPGPMFTRAGGAIQPQLVDLNTPGVVRYNLSLADTENWPQGEGVLARVTLTPLAMTENSQLQLTELVLIDETGQRQYATPANATLIVTADPPAPAKTQAAESVAVLALATPGPNGAIGEASAGGLPELLAGLPGGGAVLAWLGALMIGLAVAALGWMMGRRPVV